MLFKYIDNDKFEKNLDLDFYSGGAGWNKLRAKSFSDRVADMLKHSTALDKDYQTALIPLAEYLIELFKIDINEEAKNRMVKFLQMRVENKIDIFELKKRLDLPMSAGGAGLYRSTVDKIVREVEMILLLKFSNT